MNQHQPGRYDPLRCGRQNPYGATQNPNEYIYVSGYGFAPPPPAVSERRLLRTYSTHLGWAVMAFLFFSNLFYGLVYALLRTADRVLRLLAVPTISAPALSELAAGLSYLLALLLPFLIYARQIRLPLQLAVPMRKPNWRITLPAIPIALAVTVVGMFSSMAIGAMVTLFGMLPTAPDLSMPTLGGVGILYFINSAVLPAFAEEIVFRGVVMQSLRRFGDAFALLTSAVLFGVVHGNLIQAPNAFLAGLVIGYFVLRTGSLWTGILIHFTNNALAILISAATAGASASVQLGVTYLVYLVYILAGVVCLIVVVRENSNLFVFEPSNTITGEREKFSCFFTSAGMVSALVLLAVLSSRYLVVL